jgi:hypothetical protein
MKRLLSAAIAALALLSANNKNFVEHLDPQIIVEAEFNICDQDCWEQTVEASEGQVSLGEGRTVFEVLFGCQRWPCLISRNFGGENFAYALAGKAARRLMNASFRVENECDSACPILLDMVRERVCINPNAVFGFHKGYHMEWVVAEDGTDQMHEVGRFVPFYSFDLDRLIRQRGGYRDKGMTWLFPEDVTQIWKECRQDPMEVQLQKMLHPLLPNLITRRQ